MICSKALMLIVPCPEYISNVKSDGELEWLYGFLLPHRYFGQSIDSGGLKRNVSVDSGRRVSHARNV